VLHLLLVPPARADWLFAPLVGLTFKGSTNIVNLEAGAEKKHWNVGGTAGWLGAGPIGVEGLFVFTPHILEADGVGAVEGSHTYALMGNVIVAAPLEWNEYGLRPFVSGGLGLLHLEQETGVDPRAFPINRNLLAYNVGGGAIGSLSDHTAVRFDLRYFTTLERPEAAGLGFGPVRLSYWTTFVGVVLRY
jgi:opacity protein-like surface antigen